jgi:hypothetical protein
MSVARRQADLGSALDTELERGGTINLELGCRTATAA